MEKARESFGSRLGFLLVSAGCAIGIGNVWRFPFVVGQNGGGIFVLIYLIMLVVMGLPVLSMELAVGRASRKSAVLAYKALEKPGTKWHIHGWFAILGCYVLMMYYTNDNDNYYEVPVTKYVNDKREKVEIIIEELSGFIYHDNLVSMLSNNIRLVDYKVSSDRVSLVFDEGFTSFSDIMVKPLFCSIFANYDVDFVDISVNEDKILEKSKKDIENY